MKSLKNLATTEEIQAWGGPPTQNQKMTEGWHTLTQNGLNAPSKND